MSARLLPGRGCRFESCQTHLRRFFMINGRRVLLLNASYEPLSLVTAPKALALVWRRVAETLEIDSGVRIRSPRFIFAAPSVVRLTHYIDLRSRQNRVTNRHRIFARDRHRCQYCGRRGTRSEEHTSELQSHHDIVCRLLLEKKKKK